MRCLALLSLCLVFSACAGSPADIDFRSKVKSVTVDTSGSFDPVTKATSGAVRASFEFRDPRGFAK